MESRQDDRIYAVSFLLYTNDEFSYKEYSNVPIFSIGYQTEIGFSHRLDLARCTVPALRAAPDFTLCRFRAAPMFTHP